MKRPRGALAAILVILLLELAACTGDVKVSGTVTNTWQWVSMYRCGKTWCFTTHYMFVVNGKTYEDDWDGASIWVGDKVSFTYGWTGVSNLHDSVEHPFDWTGIIIVGIIVAIAGVLVAGGEAVHGSIEDE